MIPACYYLSNGECRMDQTEPKWGCKYRRKDNSCGLLPDEVKKATV